MSEPILIEPIITSRLRFAALGLAVFGTLVTPVDLLLVSHTQKPTQLIPFVLLAINASLIAWLLLRPNVRVLRTFQIFALFMLLGGMLGAGFHLNGNLEVARQISPNLNGLPWLLEGLRGSNPVLAPGLFAQIALLGLMFSYRHPVLQRVEARVTRTKLESKLN